MTNLRFPFVESVVNKGLIEYCDALSRMENIVNAILINDISDRIWLLEHDHVYTAGTSANDADLINADNIPVIKTGRGGKYTYHGPGQRIVYVMIDMKRHVCTADIRKFIFLLEEWLINSFKRIGLNTKRFDSMTGIWTNEQMPRKIAAIGIRVRRWVSFHGVSININTDMQKFEGIVPCGIKDYKATSLCEIGFQDLTIDFMDNILIEEFNRTFMISV